MRASNTTNYICQRYEPPISSVVWELLKDANKDAVAMGWASEGVFATGVGTQYRPGDRTSLLYVGKSAGPRGGMVGSSSNQIDSGKASTDWMQSPKNNPSAFWKFVDKITGSRQELAWTNVCKMDSIDRSRPPSQSEWLQVSSACVAALADEMVALSPRVVVFATSKAFKSSIVSFLQTAKYELVKLDFDDGWTSCRRNSTGQYAIQTRHPQGWEKAFQDPVINLIRGIMSE